MTSDSFSRIEISELEGRAQSVRLRQKLFHSLYTTLRSSDNAIKQAIAEDTGHSDHEIDVEYSLTISELRAHYESLDLGQELESQRALENLDATTSVGIVYIIPTEQNLLYSVISALTAALAAGNCIILELPTTLTRISGVLRELLPSALDADIFAISNARPSSEFLSKCYVLDQTDDFRPARSDGGGHLQSGSSPMVVAIVDRTANVPEAAITAGASRTAFNSHATYSPELILVNEFVADEFVFHVVQAVTSPVSEHEKRAPQQQSKLQSDAQAKAIKALADNGNLKLVMSGANGSVVEVKDWKKAPLGYSNGGRVVIILRITSLDNAIDLCQSFHTPLQASYIFGGAAEANYLSRFIDARISCINHIPAELLVGPFAPHHSSIGPNPSPRYIPAMFRSPRRRMVQMSGLSGATRESARSRSSWAVDVWSQSTLDLGLRAINQKDGKAVGFFDVGIMLAGAIILSISTASAYALFRFARRG